MFNCTFNANEAATNGGAISNGGDLYVRNSILWANTATQSGPQINNFAGLQEVTYSDVQMTNPNDVYPGDGNINANPMFVDEPGNDDVLGTIDDNLRLDEDSLCRNEGNNMDVQTDAFDMNNNGNTSESLDRDRTTRILNIIVDMGAYENHASLTCCADINGSGCVNTDDLLAVINGWGEPGLADVAPDCGGDGTVSTDDLLAVINGWGGCVPGTQCSESGMPTSVSDCMNEADQRFTAYSPEWDEYVNDCVDALCKAEIIDCD